MCLRILARNDAVHLLQFCHQVGLDVQAAGRIHDDDVRIFCLGGGDGVEHDGGRIAPLLVLDDTYLGAVRPDGELVRRRRAESICRGEGNALFFLYEIIGELADGRRLADAVDAHQHEYGGILYIRHFRLVEDVLDDVLQQIDDVLLVLELFAAGLLADLPDDLLGGGDGDVGGNEDLLQFVIKIVADAPSKTGRPVWMKYCLASF